MKLATGSMQQKLKRHTSQKMHCSLYSPVHSVVHVGTEGTSVKKQFKANSARSPAPKASLGSHWLSKDSQTNASQSVTGIKSESRLTLQDTRMFPKTKILSPTICAGKEPDRHAKGATWTADVILGGSDTGKVSASM